MKDRISIFWFRRDLRLDDNHGLYEALKNEEKVLPIFIFDANILDALPKDDARVTFIFDTLQKLKDILQNEHKSDLAMYYGNPLTVFELLVKSFNIASVYTNHDYEPYAQERDTSIASLLNNYGINFKTFKD